jgi:hypothetical protein
LPLSAVLIEKARINSDVGGLESFYSLPLESSNNRIGSSSDLGLNCSGGWGIDFYTKLNSSAIRSRFGLISCAKIGSLIPVNPDNVPMRAVKATNLDE